MVRARHRHNEWYEELSALAAIGQLSKSEFDDLQNHLVECAECRELHADFRRLAADDLGLVAAREQSSRGEPEASATLDEDELLSRFFARAQREGKHSVAEPQQPVRQRSRGVARVVNWLSRPIPAYAVAALLLCTSAAIVAYRLRDAELSRAAGQLRSELNGWKEQLRSIDEQGQSAAAMLRQTESSRDELRAALDGANSRLTADEAQRADLQAQLATVRAQSDKENQELAAAKTSADQRESRLTQLEARLDETLAREAEVQKNADDLRADLAMADAAAKTAAPSSNGDAKNLFGARDLHIVDVYDVDANGETKRTYGRVYYVEKKLLVFYAFDLDKGRHRAPAGFQAWGYRQANQSKPDNLGLFAEDDASLNRWVLTVNNPHILDRIDAVFVTLEPPAGSTSPKGRRLLYANLAGPANHP